MAGRPFPMQSLRNEPGVKTHSYQGDEGEKVDLERRPIQKKAWRYWTCGVAGKRDSQMTRKCRRTKSRQWLGEGDGTRRKEVDNSRLFSQNDAI
jgi:hypothetical protein